MNKPLLRVLTPAIMAVLVSLTCLMHPQAVEAGQSPCVPSNPPRSPNYVQNQTFYWDGISTPTNSNMTDVSANILSYEPTINNTGPGDFSYAWVMLTTPGVGNDLVQIGPAYGTYTNNMLVAMAEWQLPSGNLPPFIIGPITFGSVHSYEVSFDPTSSYFYAYMDGTLEEQLPAGSFVPTQAQIYGEMHSQEDQMFGDTQYPEVFSNAYYIENYHSTQIPIANNSQTHTYFTVTRGTPSPFYFAGVSTPSSTQVDTWDYACPPNEMAFSCTNGHLCLDSTSAYFEDLGLSMMPGSSPSIAQLSDGSYEVAFQNSQGNLCTYSTANGTSCTSLGMNSATSSPSITALPSDKFMVVFRANNNELYVYTPTGGGTDQNLGMLGGTNPSVAAVSGAPNGYMIAIQANSGLLWTSVSPGAGVNQSLGMASGTNPSISGTVGGGYVIAFQANTGKLWETTAYQSGLDGRQTMQMCPGTSPSVSGLTGGGYEVTYEDSFNYQLWVSTGPGTYAGTGLYAASDTSPSLVATPQNVYWISYNGQNGHLIDYMHLIGADSTVPWIYGGTDPSIAP